MTYYPSGQDKPELGDTIEVASSQPWRGIVEGRSFDVETDHVAIPPVIGYDVWNPATGRMSYVMADAVRPLST